MISSFFHKLELFSKWSLLPTAEISCLTNKKRLHKWICDQYDLRKISSEIYYSVQMDDIYDWMCEYIKLHFYWKNIKI